MNAADKSAPSAHGLFCRLANVIARQGSKGICFTNAYEAAVADWHDDSRPRRHSASRGASQDCAARDAETHPCCEPTPDKVRQHIYDTAESVGGSAEWCHRGLLRYPTLFKLKRLPSGSRPTCPEHLAPYAGIHVTAALSLQRQALGHSSVEHAPLPAPALQVLAFVGRAGPLGVLQSDIPQACGLHVGSAHHYVFALLNADLVARVRAATTKPSADSSYTVKNVTSRIVLIRYFSSRDARNLYANEQEEAKFDRASTVTIDERAARVLRAMAEVPDKVMSQRELKEVCVPDHECPLDAPFRSFLVHRHRTFRAVRHRLIRLGYVNELFAEKRKHPSAPDSEDDESPGTDSKNARCLVLATAVHPDPEPCFQDPTSLRRKVFSGEKTTAIWASCSLNDMCRQTDTAQQVYSRIAASGSEGFALAEAVSTFGGLDHARYIRSLIARIVDDCPEAQTFEAYEGRTLNRFVRISARGRFDRKPSQEKPGKSEGVSRDGLQPGSELRQKSKKEGSLREFETPKLSSATSQPNALAAASGLSECGTNLSVLGMARARRILSWMDTYGCVPLGKLSRMLAISEGSAGSVDRKVVQRLGEALVSAGICSTAYISDEEGENAQHLLRSKLGCKVLVRCDQTRYTTEKATKRRNGLAELMTSFGFYGRLSAANQAVPAGRNLLFEESQTERQYIVPVQPHPHSDSKRAFKYHGRRGKVIRSQNRSGFRNGGAASAKKREARIARFQAVENGWSRALFRRAKALHLALLRFIDRRMQDARSGSSVALSRPQRPGSDRGKTAENDRHVTKCQITTEIELSTFATVFGVFEDLGDHIHRYSLKPISKLPSGLQDVVVNKPQVETQRRIMTSVLQRLGLISFTSVETWALLPSSRLVDFGQGIPQGVQTEFDFGCLDDRESYWNTLEQVARCAWRSSDPLCREESQPKPDPRVATPQNDTGRVQRFDEFYEKQRWDAESPWSTSEAEHAKVEATLQEHLCTLKNWTARLSRRTLDATAFDIPLSTLYDRVWLSTSGRPSFETTATYVRSRRVFSASPSVFARATHVLQRGNRKRNIPDAPSDLEVVVRPKRIRSSCSRAANNIMKNEERIESQPKPESPKVTRRGDSSISADVRTPAGDAHPRKRRRPAHTGPDTPSETPARNVKKPRGTRSYHPAESILDGLLLTSVALLRAAMELAPTPSDCDVFKGEYSSWAFGHFTDATSARNAETGWSQIADWLCSDAVTCAERLQVLCCSTAVEDELESVILSIMYALELSLDHTTPSQVNEDNFGSDNYWESVVQNFSIIVKSSSSTHASFSDAWWGTCKANNIRPYQEAYPVYVRQATASLAQEFARRKRASTLSIGTPPVGAGTVGSTTIALERTETILQSHCKDTKPPRLVDLSASTTAGVDDSSQATATGARVHCTEKCSLVLQIDEEICPKPRPRLFLAQMCPSSNEKEAAAQPQPRALPVLHTLGDINREEDAALSVDSMPYKQRSRILQQVIVAALWRTTAGTTEPMCIVGSLKAFHPDELVRACNSLLSAGYCTKKSDGRTLVLSSAVGSSRDLKKHEMLNYGFLESLRRWSTLSSDAATWNSRELQTQARTSSRLDALALLVVMILGHSDRGFECRRGRRVALQPSNRVLQELPRSNGQGSILEMLWEMFSRSEYGISLSEVSEACKQRGLSIGKTTSAIEDLIGAGTILQMSTVCVPQSSNEEECEVLFCRKDCGIPQSQALLSGVSGKSTSRNRGPIANVLADLASEIDSFARSEIAAVLSRSPGLSDRELAAASTSLSTLSGFQTKRLLHNMRVDGCLVSRFSLNPSRVTLTSEKPKSVMTMERTGCTFETLGSWNSQIGEPRCCEHRFFLPQPQGYD